MIFIGTAYLYLLLSLFDNCHYLFLCLTTTYVCCSLLDNHYYFLLSLTPLDTA